MDIALTHLCTATCERVADKLERTLFDGITADLWSSCTVQPRVRVHYINEDWSLQSVCLQTCYFPDDHAGKVISQGLKDTLASWKLREDRQVCLTTNSGSNMIKALKLNEWSHLQCFGHRLHTASG